MTKKKNRALHSPSLRARMTKRAFLAEMRAYWLSNGELDDDIDVLTLLDDVACDTGLPGFSFAYTYMLQSPAFRGILKNAGVLLPGE